MKFEPPPLDVPQGFEVTVAAAPPLVEHPMMACLDDRGRLFISESDGKNRDAQQLIQDHPHKILMLEDTNGDGMFDKRSVFAEDLLLPNGAEWYDGALYVCSAPYLWRFRDLDGDGRADESKRIAGFYNFDGRSSAFHGPQLGPDGRMYWSGGQHGWMIEDPATAKPRPLADPKKLGYDSAYAGPWTNETPGTFSCWPDGSDHENLAYGGICNPVETAFTPEGEVLGTVAVYDYLNNTLRRDAVLHWIDGGVFNLTERKYAGIIRTGKDLTPVSYRGHSAPSGIMRYRGDQFGAEFRDNFFFTEFNKHQVYRLIVERDGATFRSRDEVFLSSNDTDTHFTDVMEDVDGSLLVVDTGGWFMYGCPTSQIAKPSIKGAIYRVRKQGALVIADARGNQVPWSTATDEQLAQWLVDSRLAVVDRALMELTKRGASAVPALQKALASGSPTQRLQCVWALTRIHDNAARNAVRQALADTDFSVRLAALHSVAVHRDAPAAPQVVPLLMDESAAIRREAATALGRIRAREAVVPLLRASAFVGDDRFLDHSITLALIRIGDGSATVAGLNEPDPRVRRAALVALDQMHSDLLTRDKLSSLLESGSDLLESAALSVLRNRPAWGDDMSERIAAWLTEPNLTAERETELRGALRAFWKNSAIERVTAEALAADATSIRTKQLILETMALIDAEKLPEQWANALGVALKSSHDDIVHQAIATISARNINSFDAELADLARAKQRPNSLRLAAVLALLRHADKVPDDIFDLLVNECRSNDDSIDRLAAAQALAAAPLASDQRSRLIALVADAGPLELPALVNAFDGCSDPTLGASLTRALEHSPGTSALSADRLARVFHAFPDATRASLTPLLARLGRGPTDQADRMNSLVDKLHGGDAGRGREVFFGQRASCFACHRVEDQGGNIGPDLSHIAEIRVPRDLIESVVFPSASFARGFESVDVTTNAGKTLSGYLCRDTPQAVYLRTADRTEVRIARDTIEELRPGTVSIMPEGLDQVLPEDQLRDLIAYLATLKK